MVEGTCIFHESPNTMFTPTTIRKLAAFTFLFPFTALLFIQTSDSQALAESNFVRADGTQFVVNGKHLYINGFNSYWLMVMASYPSGDEHVTSAFQQAAALGMTLARTWAFGDGGYRPLQGKLGSYNEEVFKV